MREFVEKIFKEKGMNGLEELIKIMKDIVEIEITKLVKNKYSDLIKKLEKAGGKLERVYFFSNYNYYNCIEEYIRLEFENEDIELMFYTNDDFYEIIDRIETEKEEVYQILVEHFDNDEALVLQWAEEISGLFPNFYILLQQKF